MRRYCLGNPENCAHYYVIYYRRKGCKCKLFLDLTVFNYYFNYLRTFPVGIIYDRTSEIYSEFAVFSNFVCVLYVVFQLVTFCRPKKQ